MPFDLWTEETRIYLEHLGVNRLKLMQTFPNEKLAPDFHQRDHILAAEYLGLYKKELEIITGVELEDKTPAQKVGIGINSNNKWLTLIKDITNITK